jgi:hypothetical protein
LNYYWKKTEFVKKPWENVWFFWVMRLFKKSYDTNDVEKYQIQLQIYFQVPRTYF